MVIPEVVVMMDEAVIKGFEGGVTNELKFQGTQGGEFPFDRSFGYFREGNGVVSSRGICIR